MSTSTHKGVILIVDDTPTNLKVLFDCLTNAGFKILVAEDGESAIEKAKYALPDLILLDIIMPNMDGFETCRRLKADEATVEIPVIFMTALTETVDKVKGLSLGAVDYITKPFQQEEVLARIQTHLNLQYLARQLREQNQQLGQEIQKRLHKEAALRESEEKFRQLAENITEAVFWMSDPKKRQLLYVSPFYERIWGRFCSSLYANFMGWLEAIHPLDRSRIETVFFERALAGNYDEEYRIVRPNGEVRWIHDRGFPIHNKSGESDRVVGIAEDITERKRTEQLLGEQAALLDVATDAILVRDNENKILFWNKSAEHLYGWLSKEVLGKNADRLLYTEISPQLEAAMKTVFEQGAWQGELEQVTKTGTEIVVESRWTLVRDEFGQPKSILVVNTDITAKKKLEAQFLRAQRLESIGTLASGIAHDLNNRPPAKVRVS
jgi:PAS domain S-box-containing protein